FQTALENAGLRSVYLTRVEGRFDCDIRRPDLDARGFIRDVWDGEHDGEDNGVSYHIERLHRR
ncbi:MAG: hypothetical protein WKG01_40100, partial [Kofleriaceae bacterium]